MWSHRLLCSPFCSIILLGLALAAASAPGGEDQPKFLTDTNLFGKDIRDFDLPEESPRLCYQACVEEKRCHAFTYLRPYGWPGAGAAAHCWIKYGVSTDVRHEHCCVSGIVRPGEDPPPPPPPPKPPEPKLPPPPVRASDVKLFASPTAYKGACPARIEYRGVITAPRRGTVTYAFAQGNEMKEAQDLVFRSAGAQEVRATIMAGTPGQTTDIRESLRILGRVYCVRAPCPGWTTLTSAEAVTTLHCAEAPTNEPSPKGDATPQ